MLFLSLSPPQNRPPPAPPLSAFLECDKALAEAVNLAHVHQVKQRRIESLEAELLDLEARWREICQELATGKQKLEEIIEEGDERIKNIHTAKQGAMLVVDSPLCSLYRCSCYTLY
jgi:mediator of RNA polymerase II transcription subunit 4